jgi:hypothetical protein
MARLSLQHWLKRTAQYSPGSRRCADPQNRHRRRLHLEGLEGRWLPSILPNLPGIALWLEANAGVTTDGSGGVSAWVDQSGAGHDASQAEPSSRAQLVPNVLNGNPVLRFNGTSSFLDVTGQVLTSQQFTIFAVVNDLGLSDYSYREVFSNWYPIMNEDTSVFFGLAYENPTRARLTDNFGGADPPYDQQGAGDITNPATDFIFTGVSGLTDALIYQNTGLIAEKGSPLTTRDLTTPYHIGQQGPAGWLEHWNGDIAEIVVYNRELAADERQLVWNYLENKYATVSSPTHFVVNNTNDSGPGSLRQTVLDANADGRADQISFAPGLQGTIVLTSGPLSVTDNLTIIGPGANQITVSGDDASRVFDITAGVRAEIDGLTITHGMADQGGGIQNAGTITLSGDVISHSQATDTSTFGGGGILNLPGATLLLTNSTLSGNVAALVSTSLSLGGGLDNEGIATLTACTVVGNQAVQGGGVLNEGTIRVTDSTFTGNRANGGPGFGIGGGFDNRNGGTASVFQSTFKGNLCTGVYDAEGGGIASFGALTLTGVTVSGNAALGGDGADGVNTFGQAYGGGIFSVEAVSSAPLIITGSTISGNLAQGGNAGNNNAGDEGTTNSVDQAAGGGIESGAGAIGSGVVIINCAILGNQTIGGNVAEGPGGMAAGGGISLGYFGPDGGSLIINGSTVAGNSAVGGTGATTFRGGIGVGGGIDDEGDPLQATNLMLADNSAIGGFGGTGGPGGTGFGGGIDLSFGTFPAFLANSSLIGNLALGGTGGAGTAGGNGEGGAVGVGGAALWTGVYGLSDSSSLTMSSAQITGNQAQGGAGSMGQSSGNGLGGGVYTENGSTVTLQSAQITANRADGAPGDGSSGQAGQGLGGGVYVATGATVTADPLTIIAANHASTANDDVFGTIGAGP